LTPQSRSHIICAARGRGAWRGRVDPAVSKSHHFAPNIATPQDRSG